jgi:hypothetical protein
MGEVVHLCNPSIWEAETGGLQVQGQSGLHSDMLSQKPKSSIIFCQVILTFKK